MSAAFFPQQEGIQFWQHKLRNDNVGVLGINQFKGFFPVRGHQHLVLLLL